ncbi:MAG: RNA 3'-terminal phosphate cyclase [Acidimicrobiia bacterium]|nr:RNA 3'-terminal phosphate cyclase [Acidimicrobiia bacterium]
MIHLDGAAQTGSGTIVRLAVVLATLLGLQLHMTNARARRPSPGLRPQHLAAVRACAELCQAETEGLAVGATEFVFAPSGHVRRGHFTWDIGTAGSTTILTLAVLPIACLAPGVVTARMTGGVFQDFAPSPHHLQHVLAPLLQRMGVDVEIDLIRPGYVPRGAGVLGLRVDPSDRPLRPLDLVRPGEYRLVEGISQASHLSERRVADRMAAACEARLARAGLVSDVRRVEDTKADQPGASLAVWAESSTGARLGADRAGARRRSSEAIGRFVADSLVADMRAGATTDRHVADQLVLFGVLAEGTTRYVVPRVTEHLRTNLWVARHFGLDARCTDRLIEIDGAATGRVTG